MTNSPLFACVAENQPRFATLVENLAMSVRAFAGQQREAPFVALFVDGIEPAFRARLERLEIEVEVVPRVPGGNPLANKLRMLELADGREFGVLLALDCDTVMVSDPDPWIDAEHVSVKPADTGQLNPDEWQRIFAALGLAQPAWTLRATATGAVLPPYFNSGVVCVPHAMCAALKQGWTDSYVRLGEAVKRDPSIIREQWRWLIEQASLGCGILLADLPWRALPPAMNFPTHIPVIAASVPSEPIILHYHRDHDEQGFLYRSRTPAVDPFLDRVNRRRAELTGMPYAGIQRIPVQRRAREELTARFWALFADRSWYRSPAFTRMRKRVKSGLASLTAR